MQTEHGPIAFGVKLSDIRRCPIRSMLAAHYDADGKCHCPNDRSLEYHPFTDWCCGRLADHPVHLEPVK